MRKIFELHGLISVDGLENAKKGLSDIDKSLKKASSQLVKTGKSFEKIGTGLTKYLTAPLLAASAVVVKFGADFEKSMTTSLAIMGDVSDEMKNKMGDTAKKVSEETTFSASETAKAYYFLASAGLNAAQSIAALPKVAKFAIAGQFDLSRATDLLTDAQSALGLSSKNVVEHEENLVRVSDVLVKANTLSNASVEQFSEALTNKAGAALKMLGKDVEEGVAVLAAYADQGVKGAEAGTQFSIVLRDLQTAAIKNKSAFAQNKVSVYDSNEEMRDMSDIVGDLEVALSGLSDKQKKVTLTTLGFKEKSVASLLTLIGTSDKIREFEEDLDNAGGTTERVSKKQLNNFIDQLTMIKNKLINVTISLSEVLLPVLKNHLIPILEKSVEKLKVMVDAFHNFGPELKSSTLKLVTFIALLGPMLLTIGKVIITVGRLRNSVLLLNAAFIANPIGLVVIGVVALTAALIALNHSQNASIDKLTKWNKQAEYNKEIARKMREEWEKDPDFDSAAYKKEFKKRWDAYVDAGENSMEQLQISRQKYEKQEKQDEKDKLDEEERLKKEADEKRKTRWKEAAEENKKALEVKKALSDDWIKKVFEQNATELELIKKNRDDDLAAAKEKGAEAETIFNIKKYYICELIKLENKQKDDIKKIDEQIAATKKTINEQSVADEAIDNQKKQTALDKLKDKYSYVFNEIVQLVQQSGSIISGFYDNQAISIDNNYKKEKERIESLNISEEEKAKRIENLDAATAKKKKELARKQAILDKAMAIFSIGIYAAQAIMKAWATVGPAGAWAFTIAIGALSAIEAGIVAAKPIPAAKGAFIPSQRNGVVTQVGEGKEDEVVFPLHTGVKAMVDELISQVSSAPMSSPISRQTSGDNYHVHVGTLIADDYGLKELERRMTRITVTESQRMGAA